MRPKRKKIVQDQDRVQDQGVKIAIKIKIKIPIAYKHFKPTLFLELSSPHPKVRDPHCTLPPTPLALVSGACAATTPICGLPPLSNYGPAQKHATRTTTTTRGTRVHADNLAGATREARVSPTRRVGGGEAMSRRVRGGSGTCV